MKKSIVELGHGMHNPDGAKSQSHGDGFIHDFGKYIQFLLGKSTQDVVYLPSFGKIVPDTHAQTGIVLPSAEFLDISEAIVTCSTSFGTHA
jgi:hypothetical protein